MIKSVRGKLFLFTRLFLASFYVSIFLNLHAQMFFSDGIIPLSQFTLFQFSNTESVCYLLIWNWNAKGKEMGRENEFEVFVSCVERDGMEQLVERKVQS